MNTEPIPDFTEEPPMWEGPPNTYLVEVPPVKGEPVKKGHVVPCAKPKCRNCNGTGLFYVAQQKKMQRPDGKIVLAPINGQVPRVEKLCKCAVERFMKVARVHFNVANGQMFWGHLTKQEIEERNEQRKQEIERAAEDQHNGNGRDTTPEPGTAPAT